MYMKILLTVITVFLFTACSSNQGKLSTSSKISSKINSMNNTYDYNGHILDFPEKLRGELYYWTKPETKYNSNNDFVNGRNNKDMVFEINQRDYPTFDTTFKEYMIVDKIKIKPIKSIEKVKVSSMLKVNDLNQAFSKIIAIPFDALKDSLGMDAGDIHTIEISNDNKWIEYKLDESNYNKEEKAFIIDSPYSDNMMFNGVILRVTKLHGTNLKGNIEWVYYPDEISYLLRNPNMEYHIIIFNLKNNKNLNDNEDLIRFVALTNEGLFRQLQDKKNEFNLIDTSFLKLPKDINISYAMDNFSNVITTGDYVDINNRKKSFNAKSIYPNLDYNSAKSTKIDVKKDNKGLTLSDENINKEQVKKDDFIDFDQGL